MSATLALPRSLRSRLTALQRRVRLLRVVRGFALLVVVLGVSAAAALLADYWLDLPALARRILFRVWLGEGVVLGLLSLIVPLCRRLDAAALAAAIEEQYPQLGERLTSAVELAEASEEGHGSPTFIALLLDETMERSEPLDFRPAAPARRAAGRTLLASAILFSIAVPAFVWPRQYSEQTQRFLHPEIVAPTAPPYDLTVSPGAVVAGRGRSVSLSARLTPHRENAVLPQAATLIVEDNGEETRQALPRDDAGNFTLAYTVPGDVSYRIEAGELVSASFRITAITPVELASDSPRLTVTPPQYARSVLDVESVRGLVDLSPLRHSEVRFDFRFTRPAVSAYIEWITEGRTNQDGQTRLGESVERQPLTLSEDRQSGFWTFTALEEGKYRLILEAEHDIRTELPGGVVRVQPDRPPAVARFAGKEELRSVLPTDRIPLELEAVDDIGVASIELEYRVNDGASETQPLDLEGGTTPSAVARHVLDLTGKLQENDRLLYRFRIRDNLPAKYKGPHVLVYPADRWLTLQAARRNDPLKEQEIFAQRDEINRRLQAIREALLREKRGVYKVRQESRDETELPAEQRDSIQQLQRDNRASEKALRAVSELAEATPALQPVAERGRDIADGELRQSEQALEQAPRQKQAAERTRRFDKADEQLDSAVKRLDEMKKANDRLAQERQDRGKLEALAEREKRLAEQAAELAEKRPNKRELAEKLEREQADVAKELERLSQQSEPLKQALEQARQEQAQQLAERAQQLAQAQRDLARAEQETERQRRTEQLDQLARKQQELADKQAKLAEQTRSSLPVAQTPPLKPEEARSAVEDLKQGNTAEALRRQEQTANDLERLAQAFERAVQASTDPKEAARQLEQAEKALRQRAGEETAKQDGKPLAERLQSLSEEQKAIRQAAERLSVPPDGVEAKKLKQQIGERAAGAEQALQKQDAAQAQARMEETKDLLRRLSEMLPTLDRRRQQARREMERLRRQQEEIARRVEPLPPDEAAAKARLAESVRQQTESINRLNQLDAPNGEERRERAAAALRRALADLQEDRRADVPASQEEAKRQLERLEQALRGEQPADERARELARKQRELAEELDKVGESPQRKEELQQKQKQIAEQTRTLAVPEAPQRQREAAEATKQAAAAAQANPTSGETRKQMQEAARKLDDLARQVGGEESDADKAERLARSQAEAAAESERQPGKPLTPEGRRRQEEIAREARELHGGDEAKQEKQRAVEALRRAQQDPTQDQGRPQRQAADALRDLADRLAGRNDAAAKANQIAQQQRDLARDTTSDPKRAAERQTELGRQLRRLNGKGALPQLVETRARMADAAVALNRAKTPADAKRALDRAAESAEKLAEQLGKMQVANRPRTPSSEAHSANLHPAANTAGSPVQAPSSLPRREQSDQARQLAKQQRELRDAVRRAEETARGQRPAASDNPAEDLVRQQTEIAKQTAGLARNLDEEGGEKTPAARLAAQARRTSQEAARQMSAGALPQALREGERSAAQLRQLASQLLRTTPDLEKKTPDVSQQAAQLSQRQEQINRLLQPLANDARAQAAQQQNRQGELERQTGELMRQFQEEAGKTGASGSMHSALQRAGGNSQQARQAMRQAREQGQRGEASAEKQSQDRAAQSLDQAARAVAGAAKPSSAQASSPKAGAAMTQAAQQMARAQGQLAQGKPGPARSAMQQAAQSLGQAAQQMAAAESTQPSQPGQPGQTTQANAQGRQPGGLPDLSAYGLDAAAYAGKGWGDLSGELRTKIVQDMRANYGDDYARMIKYYFEHLADTKKK
jgi:hypothetical protein